MDKIHATTQYAIDVTYGKIIANKWEKLACKRHLQDLERQGTENFPYVFDESRANRIFEWFKICRHVKGVFSDQPIQLDNWQKFDLGSVFGWVNKKNGRRRFKTSYNRIGRGNAKSTTMSGIANYGMCADAIYPVGQLELAKYEMSPEVVCGAVDKAQAKIVWGDAQAMALKSPDILKRLHVNKTKITHKSRGGELLRLSKDAKNKDGGAPCIIIIDEYHAHQTSFVKDVTSSGKGKRSQCLEFIITTAGEDAENSPCKLEDDIVKKILLGEIIDETYFGIIREIDDTDDPHDQSCWIKANPILQNDNEYSEVLLATIKEEHDLAFGSGDASKIRQWMIKRVNRWQSDSENKYFSGIMDKWKAAAIPRNEFLKLINSRACFSGVDLSKCIDLTGDGFVFPLDDGRFAVMAHGFIPEEAVTKHEHTDRVPYRHWSKEGWCTVIDGAVIDDKYIINHIHDQEFESKIKIDELCYDPHGARQFANNMMSEGYECVEIRQGMLTLSEPTKRFRELVMQGRIVHDGNPLLTWCISNAVEERDSNGNIKLSKKNKADTQRIDLIAAVINAFVRALLKQVNKSVYETRGIRSV